jgi:outer membrane cobalamin receptor
VGAIPSTVFAQATTAAPAPERIEITGSRIRTLGATSNSPISSLNAAEINTSQPVAVEEVIRGLPAAIPAIGPGTNNGSGGVATIDLRGLGPQRILVLINGSRAVPADLTGRVDTNAIPVALLERIDLVTGGASAVYGADAVSGVCAPCNSVRPDRPTSTSCTRLS